MIDVKLEIQQSHPVFLFFGTYISKWFHFVFDASIFMFYVKNGIAQESISLKEVFLFDKMFNNTHNLRLIVECLQIPILCLMPRSTCMTTNVA